VGRIKFHHFWSSLERFRKNPLVAPPGKKILLTPMAVSMNQSRKVNAENDHEAGLIKMNGQCAKNSTSSFINSPTSEHHNQKQHSVTFTIRKFMNLQGLLIYDKHP